MNRVVVTGIGMITAIGNSVEENHQALIAGRPGIGTIKQFPTRYANMPSGEVGIDTESLKAKLNIGNPGVTRTSLLALHAAEEAIADAGLTTSQLNQTDTALVAATTVGGICLTDELYNDTHGKSKSPEYLGSYDYASVSLFLQNYYGIKGIVNTINTACSSSANAIIYATRLIKNGLAKRAIVGGADSLAKFTINGFNALRILSDEVCRPFDEYRKGLNLGEGAAFLVLEREEDVKDKPVYCYISGYGNAGDAYHPSSLSSDGEGPYKAMQQALAIAGLNPQDIDFINAHGTATENNDEAESRAMIRVFSTVPPFASTKSYTGHTLGAANTVETIYGILSIYHQELYPSLNFETPITGLGLKPVDSYAKANIKHVMSNSFGFGGNCATVIVSKI